MSADRWVTTLRALVAVVDRHREAERLPAVGRLDLLEPERALLLRSGNGFGGRAKTAYEPRH